MLEGFGVPAPAGGALTESATRVGKSPGTCRNRRPTEDRGALSSGFGK